MKYFEFGKDNDTLVVMLIPARTDTRYFHDFIKSDTITIILKELQFKGVKIPHVITNHSYYGLIVESSSNYLNH